MYNTSMYIDKFFETVINDIAAFDIPKKDFRILKNLFKLINSGYFLTDRQGELLVRILSEHNQFFEIDPAHLAKPLWSKPFRVVDRTRKLSIVHLPETQEQILEIEFTFSSSLRKSILNLSNRLTSSLSMSGKCFHAELSEQNIVVLVDGLTKLNFDIDAKILEYYNTITSWKINDYIDQYRITTISHPNFQKHLANDLGIDTPLSSDLIADRSIRYQYYTKDLAEPQTLTSKIAHRSSSKIWINSNEFTLTELLASVIELKRLPVLVVFDGRTPKSCLEDLKTLSDGLKSNNISNDVGIYFRLSNVGEGIEFNNMISANGYNKQLTPTLNVVGIQQNKIPKFMILNDWKPMTVISIGNTLKSSKIAVYANCCDLIISYTENEPIIDMRPPWE